MKTLKEFLESVAGISTSVSNVQGLQTEPVVHHKKKRKKKSVFDILRRTKPVIVKKGK